ncbi:DUF4231 domain-containing protein [Parafrankia sp. BMG5.11]|uniref:DUF4231 domain-containing protein n=1 Tax=Parafrankia sp. BMG5.11 TaxID=222540 RepID=UPI001A9CD061|nr:DUF4231 domain-containing protein [Parafrankia sp. BMG5.11]
MFFLLGSLAIVGFLGATTAGDLWRSHKAPFSYAGLVVGVIAAILLGLKIMDDRFELDKHRSDLLALQSAQIGLAAQSSSDPVAALRIYRVASQADVTSYSREAARNRRVHNSFQAVIIIGSIAVTSLTSATATENWISWTAAGIAGMVGISAGFTGYFKYRERSFNQQQTADAIAKESKAVELRIGIYDCDEGEALRKFAQKVEELKEEQRKKELQLEQTSNPQDSSQT